jgi:hypothetical protein
MPHHGDVRCADCEHYDPDGCEEAAEALVQEGWPRASVCPEDDADASRCPEFLPGRTLALNLDEERSERAERLRDATLRGCGIW